MDYYGFYYGILWNIMDLSMDYYGLSWFFIILLYYGLLTMMSMKDDLGLSKPQLATSIQPGLVSAASPSSQSCIQYAGEIYCFLLRVSYPCILHPPCIFDHVNHGSSLIHVNNASRISSQPLPLVSATTPRFIQQLNAVAATKRIMDPSHDRMTSIIRNG